jgi:hypothetical protein
LVESLSRKKKAIQSPLSKRVIQLNDIQLQLALLLVAGVAVFNTQTAIIEGKPDPAAARGGRVIYAPMKGT